MQSKDHEKCLADVEGGVADGMGVGGVGEEIRRPQLVLQTDQPLTLPRHQPTTNGVGSGSRNSGSGSGGGAGGDVLGRSSCALSEKLPADANAQ